MANKQRKTISLTPTEIDHVIRILQWNEDEGKYTGNRKDYWNCHNNIMRVLHSALGEEWEEYKP